MLLTVILIIISIPSPLTLSIQAENLPFLEIPPTVDFVFFSRTDYMDSLDCLLILLSISVFFNFFSVLGLHLLVVGSMR